jgi:hypothetical protein
MNQDKKEVFESLRLAAMHSLGFQDEEIINEPEKEMEQINSRGSSGVVDS